MMIDSVENNSHGFQLNVVKDKLKTLSFIVLYVVLLLFLNACTTQASRNIDSNNVKAANANARLGAAYLRKGAFDLANEKLQKALEQDPKSPEVHHIYALLQERLGQDDKAGEHFLRALALDDENPELHNNYGSYLCRVGNVADAEKAFLKALKYPLYKTPEFAYTNAGICVMDNGEEDKAEEYFRQALKVNSRFASALYQMARLSFEQKNYGRAEAYLQRYNKVAQKNAESLWLCVNIAQQLKDAKMRQECSSRLVQLFPDSKEAAKLDSL